MAMIITGTICKIVLLAFLLCFIIGLMIPTPTVTIKIRGSIITDIFYPPYFPCRTRGGYYQKSRWYF